MTESNKRVALLLVGALLAGAGGYAVAHVQRAHNVEPLVDAFLLLGNPRRAIDAFQALDEASRGGPLVEAGLALVQFERGRQLERQQKPAESLASFQEAIRIRPDVSYFHAALGAAFDAEGRPDKALASFEEAARLDARAVGARIRLFGAYMEAGRSDTARQRLEELVGLAADEPPLANFIPQLCADLATAYEEAGNATAAAEVRRLGERIRPR